MTVVQPRVEILDNDMLQKMKAYPTHDVKQSASRKRSRCQIWPSLKDAAGNNIMVSSGSVIPGHHPAREQTLARQQNPYQPQVPALEDAMLHPNGSPQGGRLMSIRGALRFEASDRNILYR